MAQSLPMKPDAIPEDILDLLSAERELTEAEMARLTAFANGEWRLLNQDDPQ